jgi:hypothetical protein
MAGLDGAVAHTRIACCSGAGRRRACLGSSRLPPTSTAAAPGCADDHGRVRGPGAARSRVAAETAGSRHVHGGGHRELRVRSTRDRAGHQCPPRAGQTGLWSCLPQSGYHAAGTNVGRGTGSTKPATRVAVGHRFHGARCIGVPSSQSQLRCLPRGNALRVAPGRISGVERRAAARPGLRGNGPRVPGRFACCAAIQRGADHRPRADGGMAGFGAARPRAGLTRSRRASGCRRQSMVVAS